VDVEKLERVVVNLVSNALKFTEKGSVTVYLDSNPRRRASRSRTPGWAFRPRPSPRCSSGSARATRRSRGGSGDGLGLAYAKEIVELHSGRITVASTPGEGSKFAVHWFRGKMRSRERVRDRRMGPAAGSHPKRRG
jgi:signal transduction histidine kinase